MFNGIFGKFFEHGASLPPPPPLQGGAGLSMFGVCTPCCDGGISSEIFCLMNDPTYFGRLAIINGGGIFPLDYKGINDLGYQSWRGIVRFTHGIAGTLKLHEPVGDISTLLTSSPSINNLFIGNPCPSFEADFPLKSFTKSNWNSLAKNLSSIDETSDQFYMCTRHEFVEKSVVFPDVEYEYYRIPTSPGDFLPFTWRMRFRYTSSEEFGEPREFSGGNLNDYLPTSAGYSVHSVCATVQFIKGFPDNEAGGGQYTVYPYDRLTPNYLKLPGEILGSLVEERTPILFGTDSPFWNWIVPVYSNDMIEYFAAGNRSYDTEYEGSAYYWRGTYPGEPFTPRLTFVGVTENDRDLQANYPDSFGYDNYYSDNFDPKFAITITHPLFPSTYIEDTASLYLNRNMVNSRNYHSQESMMFANGFFRAVVPYPIPKTWNGSFVPGRTTKIASRLNCQISSPSGVVNCVLNQCSDDFGIAYYGQPDKYSFIKYFVVPNFTHSFEYIKINPNGKMYSKLPLGRLFSDLENTKLNFCPDSYGDADLVIGVSDYNLHNSTTCDPTLDDATEINPSAIVKVFTNPRYEDFNPQILSDYPMILSLEAKAIVKISRPSPVFLYTQCDWPMSCGSQTVDSVGEAFLGDTTITYETANITLTELP